MRGPLARRIAGAVLLVGGILLGAHFLQATSHGPVPVEIHYMLGDPPVAAALEVSFRRGGAEEVARFETRLVKPDVKQNTRLPAGEHVMDITMVSPSGARHSVRRTIEASRDAVIRLELAHEAW